MLNLVALVVGLVLGIVTGGKIGNILKIRFRWTWVVVAAFIVREAAALSPLNTVDGVQYIYLAFVVVLIVWTLWHLRRVPGIWVVTLGATLNLIVVVANGAFMPVASTRTDIFVGGHLGQYVLMGPDTKLSWLGDWITVPWPLRETYSPGDLVIVLGIGIMVFLATRTKLDETSSRIGRYPP